ncbi:MAG: DUF4348 domain-containing protein [Flavobacteriales bacterium]
MKTKIIIISTLVFGILLGWCLNELKNYGEGLVSDSIESSTYFNDSIHTNLEINLEMENFDNFFHRFMTDWDFQISRIKFPLQFDHFKDGVPGTEIVTSKLTVDNWKHDYFFINESSIPIIYDNFELNLRKTNERVFVWGGVENGIFVTSYFKQIKGKWYLVKKEDLST